AGSGHLRLDARLVRNVEQGLLHEMRNEARVRAMCEDRRRPAFILLTQRKCAFTKRIIRTLRRRTLGICILAAPGLDAGVEVKRPLRAAELDKRKARHVDREVDEEVPFREKRLEDGEIVSLSERAYHELYAELLGFG